MASNPQFVCTAMRPTSWLSLLMLLIPTSLLHSIDARPVPTYSASPSISRNGRIAELREEVHHRLDHDQESRSLTASNIALLTITLDASSSAIEGTPNDGNYEEWLCIMDYFWTKHLEDEGLFEPLYEGNFAQWFYDEDTKIATITIESRATEKELFSTNIFEVEAGELITHMTSNVNNDDLTEAIQDGLDEGNFFKEAEVTNFDFFVQQKSAGDNPYFSTSTCGDAVLEFKFGFFSEVTPERIASVSEVEVGNMLCKTAGFYEVLFAQFDSLNTGFISRGGSGGTGDSGVHLTLSNFNYTVDLAASDGKPITITMDAKALQMPSHRKISALYMMSWMQASDFTQYVQEAVWKSKADPEAKTKAKNLFYDVNAVTFNGELRSIEGEEPEPPRISTDWCQDDIIKEPNGHQPKGNSTSDDSEDSGGEDDVAVYTFTYAFETGKKRPPTNEEVEGLLCKTADYYADKWLASFTSGLGLPGLNPFGKPNSQGSKPASLIADFVFETANWTYDPTSDYPLTFVVAAEAWNAREVKLKASKLKTEMAMTESEVEDYIKNYVWKIEPMNNTNVFFHTNAADYHAITESMEMVGGEVLYSSQSCPRFADNRGSEFDGWLLADSESDSLDYNVSSSDIILSTEQCLDLLPRIDTDNNKIVSQDEYSQLVTELTNSTIELIDALEGLTSCLTKLYFKLTTNVGIDLEVTDKISVQVCDETIKALKDHTDGEGCAADEPPSTGRKSKFGVGSDGGDQDDSEEDDSDDEFGGQINTFTLQYGFVSGKEREPTEEEMEGLMAGMTAFYSETFFNTTADATDGRMLKAGKGQGEGHGSGGKQKKWISCIDLEISNWTYDQSQARPLTVYLDGKAWNTDGKRVPPNDLMNKMKTIGTQKYIVDYVWNTAPEGEDNLFYNTNDFGFEGVVQSSLEGEGGGLYASEVCGEGYERSSSDDPPGDPIALVTVEDCLAMLNSADTNQDMLLAQNEYIELLSNLTSHIEMEVDDVEELAAALQDVFANLTSTSEIDLQQDSEISNRICHESLQALFDHLSDMEDEDIGAFRKDAFSLLGGDDNDGSSDSGDEGRSKSGTREKREEFVGPVTTFAFNFNFQPGRGRAPTNEEMGLLICETANYFADQWMSNTIASNGTSGEESKIDDLIFDASNWTYDASAPLPLTVNINAKVWDEDDNQVDPSTVMTLMNEIDVEAYVFNYVSPSSPEDLGGMFYYINEMTYNGFVNDNPDEEVRYSSNSCPGFADDASSSLDDSSSEDKGMSNVSSTLDMPVCLSALNASDMDHSFLLSEEEYIQFIDELTGNSVHISDTTPEKMDELSEDLEILFEELAVDRPGSSEIDLQEEEMLEEVCKKALEILKDHSKGKGKGKGKEKEKALEEDQKRKEGFSILGTSQQNDRNKGSNSKKSGSSSNSTDDSDDSDDFFDSSDEEGPYDGQVARYTVEVAFEAGRAQIPNEEEMGGMLCQTANYYADGWLSGPGKNMTDGPKGHVNSLGDVHIFVLELSNWTFDISSEYPLTFILDARAWDGDKEQIAPGELVVAMKDIDVASLIMDYIWRTNPEGAGNLFYYTSGMTYRGVVTTRSEEEEDNIMHSSKSCPRFKDRFRKKKLPQLPNIQLPDMSQCLPLLNASDTDFDFLISEDEYLQFVGDLIGSPMSVAQNMGELFEELTDTFDDLEPISLSQGSDLRHRVCHDTLQTLEHYINEAGGSVRASSSFQGFLPKDPPEVTVDANFMLAIPKGQPVSEQDVQDAFVLFVEQVGGQTVIRRKRNLRGLQGNGATEELGTVVETNTAKIESVAPVECPTQELQNELDCYEATGTYKVMVTDGEDPEEVAARYTDVTQQAIEQGLLEESLDTVNPATQISITADPNYSGEQATPELSSGTGGIDVFADADHYTPLEKEPEVDNGCGIFKGPVCEAAGLGATLSIILVASACLILTCYTCFVTALQQGERRGVAPYNGDYGHDHEESARLVRESSKKRVSFVESTDNEGSASNADGWDAAKETANEAVPLVAPREKATAPPVNEADGETAPLVGVAEDKDNREDESPASVDTTSNDVKDPSPNHASKEEEERVEKPNEESTAPEVAEQEETPSVDGTPAPAESPASASEVEKPKEEESPAPHTAEDEDEAPVVDKVAAPAHEEVSTPSPTEEEKNDDTSATDVTAAAGENTEAEAAPEAADEEETPSADETLAPAESPASASEGEVEQIEKAKEEESPASTHTAEDETPAVDEVTAPADEEISTPSPTEDEKNKDKAEDESPAAADATSNDAKDPSPNHPSEDEDEQVEKPNEESTSPEAAEEEETPSVDETPVDETPAPAESPASASEVEVEHNVEKPKEEENPAPPTAEDEAPAVDEVTTPTYEEVSTPSPTEDEKNDDVSAADETAAAEESPEAEAKPEEDTASVKKEGETTKASPVLDRSLSGESV